MVRERGHQRLDGMPSLFPTIEALQEGGPAVFRNLLYSVIT
jgi:hypothetical protein